MCSVNGVELIDLPVGVSQDLFNVTPQYECTGYVHYIMEY